MLVKLEVYRDGEFWCARGIGVSVFSQGQTFERLLENVQDALALHFEEKLERGELLQVLVLTELEVKGKPRPHRPRGNTVLLSNEEIERRKELVGRILKRRDESPPLGMTTAELVRLARQGLESYDET